MTAVAERNRPEQPTPQRDAVAPGAPHRFRVAIEGLRAVAVGLVLADHVFG